MFRFITALLFLLFFVPSVLAETFVFTAIPDTDETRLMQRFGKVAKYLSNELNIKGKYIPVKSYPAAVTAFRLNQVQLAWFGGLTGIQARRLTPGAKAIVQGHEDAQFKSPLLRIPALILPHQITCPKLCMAKQ